MAFEGINKRLSGPLCYVDLQMSKKKKSLEGLGEGKGEEKGKGKRQVAKYIILKMFENQLETG